MPELALTTPLCFPTSSLCLQGISINSQYAAAMVTLKAQLNNATGNDTSYWNNLVGTVGALDPSMLPPNYDTWGFSSYHAFLFAFTLITTIGYGEIAPKTIGGRLFLCAYAILCVPIAGIALAKIATIFMDLAEWAIIGLSPTFRKLFRFSDASRRNLLGFIAAKELIRDLNGGTLDELSFRHAFEVASNMRSEPELSYWEFIRLYLMVDNPEMQRKRRYYRLYVSATFVVLWLLAGMFSFNHFEQWGYVPSFYFSFVTLSTIGLGDYFPSAHTQPAPGRPLRRTFEISPLRVGCLSAAPPRSPSLPLSPHPPPITSSPPSLRPQAPSPARTSTSSTASSAWASWLCSCPPRATSLWRARRRTWRRCRRSTSSSGRRRTGSS